MIRPVSGGMRHVPELSDVLEAQETKEACNQRAELVESFTMKAAHFPIQGKR